MGETLPRILVTGSSGFVGRHLLEMLKTRAVIHGVARRSQHRSGAPVHSNIHWHQADIGDAEMLKRTFAKIREAGGADMVIHLAAHYDFTGVEDPEYQRTNVDGLRNVLEESKRLGVRLFVFSSSIAACDFPGNGKALNESSPPNGRHIYSRTKAQGEAMLREYGDAFRICIVRFAALCSDWCEYPPLYKFLETWLSRSWNHRMLAGKGQAAVPYLHVRDAISCLLAVLERADRLEQSCTVLASGNGCISHEELFQGATHYYFGEYEQPITIPRILVRPGIHLRCMFGRLTGSPPFERPWMADYVDRRLDVDASHTHQLLEWKPRARLEILRRLPFLIENLKADPVEWHRRNRAAMKEVRLRPNLKIYSLLNRHEPEIGERFTRRLLDGSARDRFPSYHAAPESDLQWNHRLILRQLMNAVRTRERAVFLSYCQDLAERRFGQGYAVSEVCAALAVLEELCLQTLIEDPEAADVRTHLHDHISINIRFGIDQIQETFELLEHERGRAGVQNSSR